MGQGVGGGVNVRIMVGSADVGPGGGVVRAVVATGVVAGGVGGGITVAT
ncbi:MAG TPA: hypothetical protein VF070_47055 [Streptosporangiaceae bacterium]